jgi:hypothetical protein
MKTKPFMGRKTSIVYIVTVIMVQPYWVLEIYANFMYFNFSNDLFLKTRIFEALFRYVAHLAPLLPHIILAHNPYSYLTVIHGGFTQPVVCSTISAPVTISAS